jgi:hypothetical protein
MADIPDSSMVSRLETPLPPNFKTIEYILNLNENQLSTKPMVNVIGVVRDYQPPTFTKGTGESSGLS